MPDLPSSLIWTVGTLLAAISAGSIVRLVAIWKSDPETRSKRLTSLRTWWVLVLILGAALIFGKQGICLLMLTASLLGFHEFIRLLASTQSDSQATSKKGLGSAAEERLHWSLVVVVYLTVFVYYSLLWRGMGPGDLFVVLVGGSAAIVIARLLRGVARDYLRHTGGVVFGMLLLVFCLSHAALLPSLFEQAESSEIATSLFLYLVILTESNDIFQALIGRRFGAHKRHRLAPQISPNKTWEGFWGGMFVTAVISVALSFWLTHLIGNELIPTLSGWEDYPVVWPIVIALLISISGFFGDINLSAVKRDAGVKDSSQRLPGMGGVLDRIDSLTFTAPTFYYLLLWIR